MDIHELKKAKHELERDLCILIDNRTQEFVDKTEVYPENISVRLAKHTVIGSSRCHVNVAEVSVGISI